MRCRVRQPDARRPDGSPFRPTPAAANTDSAAGSGPPAPVAPEPTTAGRARLELLALAYRELRDATLASAAVAVAFALALGPLPPAIDVWIWLGGMLLVAGFRLHIARRFARAAPDAAGYAFWARLHFSGVLATGLGWGLSAWLFPTLAQPGVLALVHGLILAGLAAAATRLLLPLPGGSLTYLIVVLTPLAARLGATADLAGLTGAACTVVFIFYLARAAARHQQTLTAAIVTRLEREALAAAVEAEHAQRVAREAELRDARERAEIASRAKGDFLAAVSHELRTPMNGVLGMLRIVRETPLTPEQREYLKTAADSAETLLQLLNDVLDFARIDAGRLELQPAPFPPGAAVRAIADLMHARARDKGLQFQLHVDDHLPAAIIADAARLRQILVALISNAIKFTERGRIDLTLTCAERAADRAVLHFTVADTGIGIDSAALERLFKPFSQADNSLGRRYGGAGLGLAISTRLAQAMGGLLQVQSTVNRGTTFRLILPCNLPETAAAPAATEQPSRPPAGPRLGRVLVVEDDPVNQQVIDLFLKKVQVAAKFAPDGETAIQLATTETFDAILMDCHLPGIDGLETTRQLRRKLAGGRPVRIIALTANAGRSIREQCLAAGMDDFLTKPVRFEQLVEMLDRNLPQPQTP